MAPPLPLLLISGLFAASSANAHDAGPAGAASEQAAAPAEDAGGVPIKILLQYENEPAEIDQRYDNPCAYDPEGKPIKTTKNCAGVVQAVARPGRKLDWSIEEDRSMESSHLKVIEVPIALVQNLRVSSDYTRDSCVYRATVEHETKHWNANIELLKKAEPLMLKEIRMISVLPPRNKPMKASKFSSKSFRDQLDRIVRAAIDNVRKKLTEDMRESAAYFDDPARYLKDDWSKCPNPADWKGKK